MNNYDVIVVGGGLTGSALAYQLARQKIKVLLLEKEPNFNNATIFSYGGISYWCGTTIFTKRLCQESLEIHQNLSSELEADTEFRILDLLFTIDKNQNPEQVAREYQQFYIQPDLLSVQESCQLEPLLNPEMINGCLKFSQGHVNPSKIILAYQQGFVKLGGKIVIEPVSSLIKENDKIIGLKTDKYTFSTDKVVICAGAFSRKLLQNIGIKIPLYFTHAQLIKTEPTQIKLRSLVMPSTTKRFVMETEMTNEDNNYLWDNPNNQVRGNVIEAGAIQFLDGSLCIGQISQIITNPFAEIESTISETKIRQAISKVLPSLSRLTGKWYNCQVAFSKTLPFMVGDISGIKGLSIFSGFTSPFVFVPPLARYFADYLVNHNEQITDKLKLSFQIIPDSLSN